MVELSPLFAFTPHGTDHDPEALSSFSRFCLCARPFPKEIPLAPAQTL
jgi:hypothetical protein